MYKIIYSDLSEYEGGNPANSKWNNQPDKPIKRIEYKLLDKSCIFEGYEAYNHLIEKTHLMLRGEEMLTNVYLMAKKLNKVYIYKFNLITNEIETKIEEFGKEYYKTATTGWKEGLKDIETHTKFI